VGWKTPRSIANVIHARNPRFKVCHDIFDTGLWLSGLIASSLSTLFYVSIPGEYEGKYLGAWLSSDMKPSDYMVSIML